MFTEQEKNEIEILVKSILDSDNPIKINHIVMRSTEGTDDLRILTATTNTLLSPE